MMGELVLVFSLANLVLAEVVFSRTSSGLTEFPTDILEDTTSIDLSINNIVSVPPELLINLTKLEVFRIPINDLVEFPDLRPCSATLTMVIMRKNKLTIVPSAIIRELGALTYLELSGRFILM